MEKFPGSTAHPGWTAMESLTLSCATARVTITSEVGAPPRVAQRPAAPPEGQKEPAQSARERQGPEASPASPTPCRCKLSKDAVVAAAPPRHGWRRARGRGGRARAGGSASSRRRPRRPSAARRSPVQRQCPAARPRHPARPASPAPGLSEQRWATRCTGPCQVRAKPRPEVARSARSSPGSPSLGAPGARGSLAA